MNTFVAVIPEIQQVVELVQPEIPAPPVLPIPLLADQVDEDLFDDSDSEL
jgi:hypothetical protein